jgi:hypothetical protein
MMWEFGLVTVYCTLTVPSNSTCHSVQLTTACPEPPGAVFCWSFLGSQTVPMPQPQQLWTHSAFTNSIVLALLHIRKSSLFWSCSRTAFTSHWLWPPVHLICVCLVSNRLLFVLYCKCNLNLKLSYDRWLVDQSILVLGRPP